MPKNQTLSLTQESSTEGSTLRRFVEELAFFIGLTITLILPFVVYYSYLSGSEGWERWLIFLFLLTGFQGVIVGIETYESRKNRDVIQLGQRLANIYEFAIRKSALNPQNPSSDLG